MSGQLSVPDCKSRRSKYSVKTNHADNPIRSCQLEAILDRLSEIAGELEDVCLAIQPAHPPENPTKPGDETSEQRIRRSLESNLTKGAEAVTVTEVLDVVMATLEIDGGPPVPERVIRSALPELMAELFAARLSCSIRCEGRYARGWRGLAPR